MKFMKDEKRSSRLRKIISAIKIFFSLTLVSMIVFLSACIKLNPRYDWRDDIIKIDTEIQYKYPIEYSDREAGGIEINERYYMDESDYSNKYLSRRLGGNLEFDRRIDYYYLENRYWGCYRNASIFVAFGVSENDISFVYTFKNSIGAYSRCYIAEDYVFPESVKDEVSSIFAISVESLGDIYDETSLTRVERQDAEFEITDRELINEIIKNKNYDSLNSLISDNREYLILAQFDGHIIYETITVLNFEKESDTSGIIADNTEDSTMDNSVS